MTLPTLLPWHRTLLGTLFGVYVAELVLQNLWPGVYELAWRSFGTGFQVWQLATRFLVQGPDVANVVFALVALFFLLPSVESLLDRRTIGLATAAGVAGATVLPLVADAVGLVAPSAAFGWTPLVLVLPMLLGLTRPDQTILFLVFPVRAGWLLWGSLVLALLFLLVGRTLGTFQGLGVWIGVYAWHELLGPGRRRRELMGKVQNIERELRREQDRRRFEVLEGGRAGEPREDRPGRSSAPRPGNRPDDIVH